MNYVYKEKWIIREEFKKEFKPELKIFSSFISPYPVYVRVQKNMPIYEKPSFEGNYLLVVKIPGYPHFTEVERELTEEEYKGFIEDKDRDSVNILYNSNFYGVEAFLAINKFGKECFFARKKFKSEKEIKEFKRPEITIGHEETCCDYDLYKFSGSYDGKGYYPPYRKYD
jgi:hypothetical protein